MPAKKPAPSTVGFQLPLVDIVHATRPTLWTSIDLAEHGIDLARAERLSELPPAERMLLAQNIPGLTYRERMVAGAIAYRGWWCWPSIADIAMNSGIEENHVSSTIKALVKKAGLRRFKPQGQSHRYLFSGLAIAAADDARSEREAAMKGSRNGTSSETLTVNESSQTGSFAHQGSVTIAEKSRIGTFMQDAEPENSQSRSFLEPATEDTWPENSQSGSSSEPEPVAEPPPEPKNSRIRSYSSGISGIGSEPDDEKSQFGNVTGSDVTDGSRNNLNIGQSIRSNGPSAQQIPPPDWHSRAATVSNRAEPWGQFLEQAAIADWTPATIREAGERIVRHYVEQGIPIHSLLGLFKRIATGVHSSGPAPRSSQAPRPTAAQQQGRYSSGRYSADRLRHRDPIPTPKGQIPCPIVKR